MLTRQPWTLLLAATLVLGVGASAWAADNATPKKAKAAKAAPVEDAQDSESDGSDETQGAEVVDQPERPAATGGARTSAAGEVHTVVKGDTLWDLSQNYLGSPWYWPKVWSYNPDIANPHWIYPGNLVRFFPSGEEVPTQVEVGTGPEGTDGEGDSTAGDVTETPVDSAPVQVAGRIGAPTPVGYRYTQVAFLTAREVEEAGVISGSFSEAEMLSFPETAYLTFKRPSEARVGDTYVIFRPIQRIRHPDTNADLGVLTKFLGRMKIVKVSEKLATAQVLDTWEDVVRGDFVGPFGEALNRVITTRPNERELAGSVVADVSPGNTVLAEHQVILIDRGSSDGVLVGNVFSVVRAHDGLATDITKQNRVDLNFPIETVGACMAIDVKDQASTCIITRSIREIVPGDRVEMRAASSSSPGSAPRASRR